MVSYSKTILTNTVAIQNKLDAYYVVAYDGSILLASFHESLLNTT